MNITISGHHIQLTDSLRQFVEQKLSKIKERFSGIPTINIILAQQNKSFHVEMNTTFEKRDIAIKTSDFDMYKAITLASKKLESALTKKSGHDHANLHEKPEISTNELAHDKIQEMTLN